MSIKIYVIGFSEVVMLIIGTNNVIFNISVRMLIFGVDFNISDNFVLREDFITRLAFELP